jgi:hemolysin activation/secretion protein
MTRNLAIFLAFARERKFTIRARILFLALIILPAAGGSSVAQQAPSQPRYDTRQTEKSLETLQAGRERENRQPVKLPGVANAQPRADTRPLFKLRAVSVEGASSIARDALDEVYRPYIGKTVSQADLAAIAVAVTDAYRAAGYHLSRAMVPPQDIKNGRIRLKVIEGYIAELAVNGEGADRFGVRTLLAPILGERPARLKTLERQLMLVNDSAGVRIEDTALQEIGKASGKFRLIVWIKTWQIFQAFGFDNMGTSAVGPLEAYTATAFNSYFRPGDNLSVNASTTPNALHEFGFGKLSYDTPVGTDGVHLGAMALYSNVAPGDIRQQFNTHTVTETYEVKASVVPVETRRSSLWLTAAAGFSDSSERDSSGMQYNDHFRTLSLMADYKLNDSLAGWNYLNLTFRHGLDIFGASRRNDDLLSRADASPNFSIFDFAFSRYQPLSDVWSVKISATGQWASGPLLVSQQFYLGDAAYGPGFYSGDSGIAAYGELRFDQSVSNDILKGYQLYAFLDKGAVWSFNNDGQVLSIASAGAGIRFFLAEQWQAGVGFAVPVHAGTTANDVHGVRVLFTLSNSFKLCPQRPQMRCL